MDLQPSLLTILILLLEGLKVDCAVGGGFRNKAVLPPPGYKHSSFRLIVPQQALATLHWHSALRHAAFLSLRRRLSSFGDGSRAERTLWEHIASAPVYPAELAKPTNEDADLTILASGLMVREAGHLAFVPEHVLLHPSAFPRKVSALWSVIRVRHSGPGLSEPQIEYYFTVQPASHMMLLDHTEKMKKFNKKPPSAGYSGPVYSAQPGQYYDPNFVDTYRNVIQKFVASNEADHSNFLALQSEKEERVVYKQDPIYIMPSPRLVKTHFPKVSNVARLNYPNPSVAAPGFLKLHVHSPAVREVNPEELVSTTEPPVQDVTLHPEREVSTKRSSRYRDNSKKSDFSLA